MAPLYESDLEKERWQEEGWKHVELWEKVQQRFRRQRRLWIFSAGLLFLFLSSIPVLIDRWPKWQTLGAARELSEKVSWMKMQAALDQQSYRILVLPENPHEYVLEKGGVCDQPETFEVLEKRGLGSEKYRFLLADQQEEVSLPNLVHQLCYDPIKGWQSEAPRNGLMAFALAPVRDLAEKRLDRLSLVFIQGRGAEIQFQ
jgi:hypothetical protein